MREMHVILSADDESDLDFIRTRAVAAVQNVVDENESRFDSTVTVTSEWVDA
jgi:hypothetical protein